MKGVTFGDYHSFDDFHLILVEKTIESAEAKTSHVEIPCADGSIDITEYFGETKYKNRKLSFKFNTIVRQNKFLELFSEIQNCIHGKKVRIIIDDDPDFYYVGRVDVSEWKSDRNVGILTIECDCEPYKYRIYETIVSIPAGDVTTVLENLRKSVIPVFETNGGVTISFKNHTYTLQLGTFAIPDLILSPGDNLISFDGAGCTVRYQEGGL